MANRNRSAQAGMTLIEVMIVTAIIGILASILMPNVRGYQARAKVSEAMLLLSGCRTTIHEAYLSSPDLPGMDNWGCEVEKPSRYVERIRTTDRGIVRLTLGNEIGDLRLSIHDITLAPLNASGNVMDEADLGTPVRRWRCGASVDGTDVRIELLPSSCRG
jgi:type IV pilus assembly protein PilA